MPTLGERLRRSVVQAPAPPLCFCRKGVQRRCSVVDSGVTACSWSLQWRDLLKLSANPQLDPRFQIVHLAQRVSVSRHYWNKAGPPWVIFGRGALIFFVWKLLEKYEKWHHFCAHAQWWSPWRRKIVEKRHLAPSNLTFLIIAIDSQKNMNFAVESYPLAF